jgi:hypothetical protein
MPVDECTEGTDDCDVNATCTDLPDGFECMCNAGYSGDGTTCTDDDECALMTDSCDVNATCANTPGSFTCACNAGYSGNGMTCTDDDECALMTDNCDVNATCTNTPGSFTCACNPPYIGNGTSCMLPPTGDLCTDPKIVGSLPYSDSDDTGLYSDNYQTGGGCPTDGGAFGVGTNETVYSFTPSSTGNYGVTITKSASSGPSLLYVTTNCGDVTNTCLADSGDVWSTSSATFGVPMTAGTTYYLMVDGWFANEDGAYTLQIAAAQPEICSDSIDNDFNGDTDCADAACAADPVCVPPVITNCDPTYCTMTAAAGPNGGDLCACDIPGIAHPTQNLLTSTSGCSLFGSGYDLIMSFDVTAYTSFSATTCNATPQDSSIAVYDADPTTNPPELYCNSDAIGELDYCSEMTDSGGIGAPLPTTKPPGNILWMRIDEYSNGVYWDGITTRHIEVELIP